MLQRIQTIYLFLAFVCWLIIYLPFGKFPNSIEILPYCKYVELYSMIFAVLTPLLNFIVIFFYKKRNWQIKGCIAAIISSVFYISSFFYIYLSKTTKINYFAFILPVIAIIFTILAIKAIKKDEKLINSADRLR